MPDIIPQVSGWLDSRKAAIRRNLVAALAKPDEFLSQLSGAANDQGRESKAAFDATRSVMPGVRAQGAEAVLNDPITGIGGAGGAGGTIMRAERMRIGGHIAPEKADKIMNEVWDMKAQGASPNQIWQYSNAALKGTPYNGIAHLPSGEMVVELSDAGSKAKAATAPMEAAGSFPTLPAALEHPELYKHNPKLGKVEVHSVIEPGQAENGSFMPGRFPDGNDPHFIMSQAPDEEKARQILLHEANHAIQDTDGLPMGGDWKREFAHLMNAGAEPTAATQELAMQNYNSLLGEIISRTVEARRNLTNETAANKPLGLTIDHQAGPRPPIVRYADGQ